MPRKCDPYCIIELSFLFGPRFVSLPASARVTYLALWGRAVDTRRIQLPYWYDTAALQRDTGLDTRTVRKSVALLQQKCLIEIDDKNVITVCGVKEKHPTLTWKETPPETPPEEIKGKSQSTLLNKPNQDKPNLTQPNLNKPPISPVGGVDLFEKFWQAYPRKIAKGHAEKAWNKIKPDEVLLSKMLENIEHGKQSIKWQEEGGKYIKHPATWLNSKGWEDVYDTQTDNLRSILGDKGMQTLQAGKKWLARSEEQGEKQAEVSGIHDEPSEPF